jgi:hypothetical protein
MASTVGRASEDSAWSASFTSSYQHPQHAKTKEQQELSASKAQHSTVLAHGLPPNHVNVKPSLLM